MTRYMNEWSDMAIIWILVVCVCLSLTSCTLTYTQNRQLEEYIAKAEMTQTNTGEAFPDSLVTEWSTSSPIVAAESPSSSSPLDTQVELQTQSNTKPLPLLTPSSVVGEKALLLSAVTSEAGVPSDDDSSPKTFAVEDSVDTYTEPVSDITSDSGLLSSSSSANTKDFTLENNNNIKGTLTSVETPQDGPDGPETSWTVIPDIVAIISENTDSASSSDSDSSTAAPVDLNLFETSTATKTLKSEFDSASTVASSNAPATTTDENQELKRKAEQMKNEEKEGDDNESHEIRQHEIDVLENEQQQQQQAIENLQPAVATEMSTQQQQQQQMAETLTTTTEQQQRILTTDVTRHTEKEMHKQDTGNAEIVVTTSYIIAGDNTKLLDEGIAAATSELTPKTDTTTILTDSGNFHQERPNTEIVYESTTFDTNAKENMKYAKQAELSETKKTETQIVLDSLQLQGFVSTISPIKYEKPSSSSSSAYSSGKEKQISLEDFKPVIQDANRRLLKERTIFTPKRDHEDEQNWKQNLLPNEIDEDYEHQNEPIKLYNNPYEHNINWSPYLHPATPVVDFTGKVLQEQDGVITEIEQKFRLNEFATDAGGEKASDITTVENKLKFSTTNTDTIATTSMPLPASMGMSPGESTKSLSKPMSISVNHEVLENNNKNKKNNEQQQQKQQHHQTAPLLVAVVRPRHEFIERRVKKSFDFPMHRMASDVTHNTMQHFDFANTKFSSNINEPMQHLTLTSSSGSGGGGIKAGNMAAVNQEHDKDTVLHVPRPQPEFSTTKFYNSKELYNEMLQHKNKQQQQQQQQQLLHHDKDNTNALSMQDHKDEVAAVAPSLTLNSFAVLHSPKIAKLEELHEQHEPQKSLAIKRVTVQATKHKETDSEADSKDKVNITSETTRQTDTTTTPPATPASPATTTTSTTTMTTTTTTSSTITDTTAAAVPTVKKFHKELKKAKLLLKTMLPARQIIGDKTDTLSFVGSASPDSITAGTPEPENAGQPRRQQMPEAAFSHKYTNNLQTLTTTTKPLETFKAERKSNTLTAATNAHSSASFLSSSAADSAPLPSKINANANANARYPYRPPSSSTSTSRAFAFAATVATSRSTPDAADVSTYPTKSALKPIVRPRILSRLQEKINSLECEIPNVPQDSHLWRGNETHELLLPIMTPENCKTDKDCTSMMVSWEGEAEIQSGDILIVEVNDALLSPKDFNVTTTSSHNTQVYQVTRSGHEHCDVTEGILLDITPLIVDGRKLVTLYDKDLTEGVNLLIVVSELWGSQCVRLKVTTKTENCGESSDCSGKGVCFSNTDMEEYECQCCSGFAGPHCEEIDACTPSPCTNNGICVDLSQGHEGNSYQCLCPYGYSGKNCQYELDPCNPAECMNGGSCVGNSTHFRCECSPGYTGPLCQHSLNECESSPCIHGICVDQEDGFRCFCQPGFAGELCNFEYNECESNPCQNGGDCIDHIGNFECHCTKGYTGNRCHIKVDFCSNKPCPEGRRCIDHGNDFACECLGGRNGPDCNEMQRMQCTVNPCTHGGTCWSSGDSFYCACRPGYTGTMCEDEFVVETVVSSSEFMVDDTSARNFNDKSFGSSVVLKSPIELHNAYTAAIVLALVIFFVALYLTICHCKVNQTYRKFSTRTYGFLPFIGLRWRPKQATSKISRHWLSGKGLGVGGNAMRDTPSARGSVVGGAGGTGSTGGGAGNSLMSSQRNNSGHLPTSNTSATRHQQHQQQQQQQQHQVGQLNERPFQRHLAMNLENDMYYTVDFSENSQHSPLIQ